MTYHFRVSLQNFRVQDLTLALNHGNVVSYTTGIETEASGNWSYEKRAMWVTDRDAMMTFGSQSANDQWMGAQGFIMWWVSDDVEFCSIVLRDKGTFTAIVSGMEVTLGLALGMNSAIISISQALYSLKHSASSYGNQMLILMGEQAFG